jgi:hypothetical protein
MSQTLQLPFSGIVLSDPKPLSAPSPSAAEKDEWIRKGVTPHNYNKRCFSCSRTGKSHLFNNECPKFN